MDNITTEGCLHLFNDFIFTGKIENGRFKEGVLEKNMWSLKFKGKWGTYYREIPTHLDEPDYDEFESLQGTIYQYNYKYVGEFVPDEFYNGKIVSYEKVKKFSIETNEFIEEVFLGEPKTNSSYSSSYSSASYSSSYDSDDYVGFDNNGNYFYKD